jgi:hypothetical protein
MEHTLMNPTRRLSLFCSLKRTSLMRQAALLGLLGISAVAGAADMQELDDGVLSQVQGKDGVSFALNLNTSIGSNVFSVDTAGKPTSISQKNVKVTGFYALSLDIVNGAAGKPDFMNWVYPDIASTKPLNIVYDMAITADGKTFGSSVTLSEYLNAGSSMQLSSSDKGGMAFGLAQKLSIASVLMQPNGLGNTGGQFSMSGVSLGAASGTGAWVIADLVNQPGQFNIVRESGGDRLQFGIDFPKTGEAAAGKLSINNITINTSGSPGTPGVPAVPGTPEIPAVAPTPYIPAVPPTPYIPAVAPTPEIPATATTPLIPATPGSPEVLATPGSPEVLATPGSPAIPATPGTPAIPAIPAIPPGPLNLGSSSIGSMQIQHFSIKFRQQ